MPQNRNKLIELFIGNIVNAIVHDILEKAIDKQEITEKYRKELKISFDIAEKYREKINPINIPLPIKDSSYIKEKVVKRVKAELNLRIEKGYENINLNIIEQEVDKILREMGVV